MSVEYIGFGALAVLAAFFIRRKLMFSSVRKNLPNYLREGAVIVDVRSPEEFRNGNIRGSINIPLQEIHLKTDRLDREKTILLCCVSGNRSGMAAGILRSKGFSNVVNAGPWVNLA